MLQRHESGKGRGLQGFECKLDNRALRGNQNRIEEMRRLVPEHSGYRQRLYYQEAGMAALLLAAIEVVPVAKTYVSAFRATVYSAIWQRVRGKR